MKLMEIWTQPDFLREVYLVSNFGHLTKVAGPENCATKADRPPSMKEAFEYIPIKYDEKRKEFGWYVDTAGGSDFFVSRNELMEQFLDQGLPVQVDIAHDDKDRAGSVFKRFEP